MAISSDYPTPVTVNGFQCRNCTDVAYAKRHIDPDHPESGPFGVNADSDPSRINEIQKPADVADAARSSDAVVVGARLEGAQSSAPVTPTEKTTGTILDVRV
jgi:hypothetical protein